MQIKLNKMSKQSKPSPSRQTAAAYTSVACINPGVEDSVTECVSDAGSSGIGSSCAAGGDGRPGLRCGLAGG
jgi:hypothetical protein